MNNMKVTRINDAFLAELEHALQGEEQVNLVIDSAGGDLEVAYKAYELIRQSSNIVSAVVRGKCYSSATIILLAVKPELRSCSRLSTFLIHSPILNADFGGINLTTSEMINETINQEFERIVDIYKDRLAIKDEKTITNLMRNETIIESEQAQLLGFVNHIEEYRNIVNTSMNLLNKVLKKILNEVAEQTIKTESGEYPIGGDLAVGVEIEAPDGTYVEESTQTIFVVEGGKVVDVKPQIEEEKVEEEIEEQPVQNEEETTETVEEETTETVEEVKEEVKEIVEETETAIEEETSEDKLAKVLEQLAERIATIEEKLSAKEVEEPKQEEVEEEVAPIENKVERKYFGYSSANKNEKTISSDEIRKYWVKK